MRYVKLVPVVLALAVMSFTGVSTAQAQARRGGAVARRAVPRAAAPRVVRPFVGGVRGFAGAPFYSPYFYGPGFSLGLYAGYPFAYGYPYYGGFPYWSGYYGYPYGPYPYGYVGGAYSAYGGVRIEGAPRNAQVYADGYYIGVVDDFDGVFQHANLTPGVHHLEIRVPGAAPVAFDVQIQPGQTITYHADLPRN